MVIIAAGGVKMFFWKKKELKESEEYAKLIKRIAELSLEVSKIDGRVTSLDVKIEAYRGEVKNVKKKAQEIVQEMESEKDISSDYPSLL